MMAMRNQVEGLSVEEIRAIPKEQLMQATSSQDFQIAMAKINKSVSSDNIKRYERWIKEFGST